MKQGTDEAHTGPDEAHAATACHHDEAHDYQPLP